MEASSHLSPNLCLGWSALENPRLHLPYNPIPLSQYARGDHKMSVTMMTRFPVLQVRGSSEPNQRRGFGNKNSKKISKITTSNEDKDMASQQRKSTSKQSAPEPTQAPGLSSRFDGKSYNKPMDLEFEERLEAVRRSALDQKKADKEKEFGVIDYESPVESNKKTIGLGTKIGVGVAVLVFGLVFALGDFLPSGSVSPGEDSVIVPKKLSNEEKVFLQNRLKEFEATLQNSPKDISALEGAAVSLTELGEYTKAISLLEKLTEEKPNDPDVFRLLGEVKYALKDYEGSASAYKTSATVSKSLEFEVVRGLTNALLAAKKPDEAVQFLLDTRERLSREKPANNAEGDTAETVEVDPVQIDLLLGKSYSDWGHVSDAITVYDQLLTSHPNDFRGYLAKGIILKQNGKVGDAERMFIQARFFAPDKAKAFVDRYSK